MNVLYFDELDSTNSYLKREYAHLPNETVVLAGRQVSGKGRMGRTWQAPDGNLSFSVLFRDQTGELALFPLFCALAGAEVLEERFGASIGIKWPNDLILQNQKLCGILCEGVSVGGQMQVICGIGVNITWTREDFDRAGLPHGTSLLLALGQTPDPTPLGEAMAARLIDLVRLWRAEGFLPLKARYEQRLLNAGREVQVLYDGHTVRAFAKGIDEHGHLVCENDTGIFTVQSGEASVRGLYGYL